SEDIATALANSLTVPVAPVPTRLFPCWSQVVPERTKNHAAPARAPVTPPVSWGPPITVVLPAADRATADPNSAFPLSPLPVSLACCVQVPESVTPHAAPTSALSPGPPITAVLPAEESATASPKRIAPLPPLAVSLACCFHFDSEKVKTQAAPTKEA